MPAHVASGCVVDHEYLQAAAALAAFTFESPTKPSKKVIDDERLPESPASLTDVVEDTSDDILSIPRKYVGEVDLPESTCFASLCRIFC